LPKKYCQSTNLETLQKPAVLQTGRCSYHRNRHHRSTANGDTRTRRTTPRRSACSLSDIFIRAARLRIDRLKCAEPVKYSRAQANWSYGTTMMSNRRCCKYACNISFYSIKLLLGTGIRRLMSGTATLPKVIRSY